MLWYSDLFIPQGDYRVWVTNYESRVEQCTCCSFVVLEMQTVFNCLEMHCLRHWIFPNRSSATVMMGPGVKHLLLTAGTSHLPGSYIWQH